MRIHPFQAIRPVPERAAQVAAVPYDVVDAAEARALATGNPCSLLHVSRAEIDLPPDTDPYAEQVYKLAAGNFAELQRRGVLFRDTTPSLYVYRQRMGKHVQTGLMVCCHVEEYEANVIRKHEKTRADKEADRIRHVLGVSANTGPVFLTYRDVEAIDRLVAGIAGGAPLYDFTAVGGIQHTVWRAPGGEALVAAFAAVPLCYIADGHHRAAAAAKAAATRRAANPGHTGHEEYNWFLAVLFPASQLQILPYNRCVVDLHGHTPESLLTALRERCTITPDAVPSPSGACQCSAYLAGRWYGLSWPKPVAADPVLVLDVSWLQNQVLEPLLGIRDPRTDKRISFVGGIRGTGELQKRVDAGQDAVAFSMYPVTVEQVMDIADANTIMPPKSTWFEPKLRSGLAIHTLD